MRDYQHELAHFRGFFGQDSIDYYPALEDCFYNGHFLNLVSVVIGECRSQARRSRAAPARDSRGSSPPNR